MDRQDHADQRPIALNHVSFRDGAVALSTLKEEPVFAVDHGVAQHWLGSGKADLVGVVQLVTARQRVAAA
jgi:hypothetical protein